MKSILKLAPQLKHSPKRAPWRGAGGKPRFARVLPLFSVIPAIVTPAFAQETPVAPAPVVEPAPAAPVAEPAPVAPAPVVEPAPVAPATEPAPVAEPAAPTATPTPAVQSPVLAPNTDVPDAPPPPGIPSEVPPAPALPRDQNPQFDDPNRVLPPPPPAQIAAPVAPADIVSASPNGAPLPSVTPTPAPTTAPTTAPDAAPAPVEGDIQSGTEAPGGDFSLESPGSDVIYDMERGIALAPGGAIFRYREFTVRGDRGLIDYNTNRATLIGNLTVTVRGQVFQGQSLTFDLDAGRWTLSNLGATFPPEVFPPGTVLEPLYVSKGTVTGDYDTFSGQNFQFTSCERGDYYIRSRKLEFYRTPGGEPSRIVLRRNAIYVLGRRILPLPVYVISLLGSRTRRQPLQATFGQNAIDGFFTRSVYDLRATPKLTDSILLDALQKRGLGLGFQREYAVGGLLYLYALSGKSGGREINARINRSYQLARGYNSNIRFDSTQNNSLTGPGVQSQNGQLSLSRTGEQAQTNAFYSFNRSSFGQGDSQNSAISLDHRQSFGSGFALEARSFLNRSQVGQTTPAPTDAGAGGGETVASTNEAATFDNSFTLSKTAAAFDIFLRAEMHDDLVNSKSYQLERLPELSLQSSTDRLGIPALSKFLPGNFSLGVGRFNEPSSDQNKGRADFFFTPRAQSYRLLGSGTSQSTFSASGNFEQAFYSDDTARYNYGYNLGSENRLGPAQFRLNYSKQRTQGFTPFQFDFSTPGEYLDYAFSLQTSRNFRLSVTGGRDIQNDFTRDIIARAQYAPNQSFYASVGTSYRLQNDQSAAPDASALGDIYANIRVARNRNRFGGGQLALGVRYDPGGRGLTRANASLDVNLGKKTRFQALAGYDGFAKTFDFTQFRITRDLHCFNLYATYDGQRNELRLDLAIKAFPFADTRFGRNQFSEGFDPSVGGLQ